MFRRLWPSSGWINYQMEKLHNATWYSANIGVVLSGGRDLVYRDMETLKNRLVKICVPFGRDFEIYCFEVRVIRINVLGKKRGHRT